MPNYLCPTLKYLARRHKDHVFNVHNMAIPNVWKFLTANYIYKTLHYYRPIALVPTVSKLLEWALLITFSGHFATSDLQFGFKAGFSTTLCTGVLKMLHRTICLKILLFMPVF